MATPTLPTCNAAFENDYRYGWYFRPSVQMYEFHWGSHSLIALDAMMLDVMPAYAAAEIKASALVKPELD